jgi:hypothetical protein
MIYVIIKNTIKEPQDKAGLSIPKSEAPKKRISVLTLLQDLAIALRLDDARK